MVIFALRAGETTVAQTSIIGSLFANALLVLGIVIVVGRGRVEGQTMRFKPRLPMDTSTLLLVTSFIIIIIGLAHASHDPAARHEQALSTIGAIALLLVYVAWVVPYLRSDDARRRAGGARGPRTCRWRSRSRCWCSAGSAPRSCPTGSSPRCGRRSTRSACRTRSRAS